MANARASDGARPDAFTVLADPVRRRLIEVLAAGGEQPAGELTRIASAEFGIGQPAGSMQLRVLRDSGFCEVRRDGARRLYRLRPDALAAVRAWLAGLHREWSQPLDALATEVARGKRERRRGTSGAERSGRQAG